MATYAGRAVFPVPFLDTRGNALAAQSITIYNRGTTVKPTLYTDRTKATTTPNPTATDASGNLWPYLDPGEYDALVGGVTIPFTILADPVELVLPSGLGGLPYFRLLDYAGTANQKMTAAVAACVAAGKGEIVAEPGTFDFGSYIALAPGVTKLRADDPERTIFRNTSPTLGGLIAAYGSGQSIEGITILGQSALQPFPTSGALVQFSKPAGTTGGGTSAAGGVLLSGTVAAGASSLPLTAAPSWTGGGLTVMPQPGEYVVLVEGAQMEVARIASNYGAGATPLTLDAPLRYSWTVAAKVTVRSTRCGVKGCVISDGIFVGVDLWGPIGGYVRDTTITDCLDSCLAASDGGAQLLDVRGLTIDTDGLFGVALDAVATSVFGATGLASLSGINVRMRPRDSRLGNNERDGVILMGASDVDLSGVTVDLSAIPSTEAGATGVRMTGAGHGYSLRGVNVRGPGTGQNNTYGIRSGISDGHALDATIMGGLVEGLAQGVDLASSSEVTVRGMVARRISGYAYNITSHPTVVQRLAVEGCIADDAFVGLAASPAPAAGSILHKRGNIYRTIGFLAESIDAGWAVNP